MKAVSYSRVSTDIQDFNRQIDACRNFCKKEDYQLIQEFHEKESGTKRKRPELTKMMDFVNSSSDIDFVVVQELSRLGRTNQVLETINELTHKRISLYSIKENLYTLDPITKIENSTAKLTLTILSGINSFELDTMKFRTKDGMRKSRINGKASGSKNIPYGYSKDANKMLVVDNEEAAIIQKIFNLYSDGNGTQKIANKLNLENIPTRKKKDSLITPENPDKFKFRMKFSDGIVYAILTNRIYIGQRFHLSEKKDEITGKRLPEYFDQPNLRIITDEQFKAVQTRLSSNINKREHYKVNNYLLDSKKITCGCCGKNYYAFKRGNVGDKNYDNRYVCLSRRYDKDCDNDGISISKIDRLVQAVILLNYSDILISNLGNNSAKNEIVELEREIEKLKLDLLKEQSNEKRLYILCFESEVMSIETYSQLVKPIMNLQKTIKNKIELNQDKLENVKISYNNMVDIKNIKLEIKKNQTTLPKNIVNKMITNIIITKIDSAPEQFKEEFNTIKQNFKNKIDKFVLVTIVTGNSELYYLLSQREKFMYDFNRHQIRNTFEIGFNDSDLYRANRINKKRFTID